jgi:hypothetical protein
MLILTLALTQRPILEVLRFSGVKRLGYEANHSLGSSAKAKNERSYTSTPLICLLGMDMKIFTFTVIAGAGIEIRSMAVKTRESSYLCFTNAVAYRRRGVFQTTPPEISKL